MLQRIKLKLVIASFLWLITLTTGHSQHQLIREVYDKESNTWIQVTALFGKLPAYGYIPIRVEFNNGTETDRSITLEFNSENQLSFGDETGGRMNSTFECHSTAGKLETYDFIVPVTTIFQTSSYGSGNLLNMKLSCTGFRQVDASMSSSNETTWPAIIVSKALYVPNASAISSRLSSSSYSGSGEFAGDFDPKIMPTNWRAYMGQEIIMLTSNDWGEIDPGARNAILEWNRLGGKLLIYTTSTTDTFASMQIEGETTSGDAQSMRRSHGTVSLIPLPSTGRLDAAKTHTLLNAGSTGYSSAATNYYSLLYGFSSGWPLEETLGDKSFNIAFFIILLLVFGVLIGPINLFVFAKSGQRHKLFITTPIISLAASLLLVIIIIFQDGFGGRGHRVMLMEIVPEENTAYITQEQIARTGVLLRSSFETSEFALISPVGLAKSRWSRVVTDGTAPASYIANDGDKGIEASGDWYQSRSIHGHVLQSVRPTRARIELSPKAGAPVLSSTFDYDLGTIFYHAKDGTWWKADALAKGNSVTLSPSSDKAFNVWLTTEATQFSKLNTERVKQLSKIPGRFYTVTDEAEAIESYRSIKWLSTKTLITGKVSK